MSPFCCVASPSHNRQFKQSPLRLQSVLSTSWLSEKWFALPTQYEVVWFTYPYHPTLKQSLQAHTATSPVQLLRGSVLVLLASSVYVWEPMSGFMGSFRDSPSLGFTIYYGSSRCVFLAYLFSLCDPVSNPMSSPSSWWCCVFVLPKLNFSCPWQKWTSP